MTHTLRVSVLLLFLCGCKDQGVPPRAVDPYELWRSYEFHDYTVDQVRVCFCPLGGQTMRIMVRADTVESVVNPSDNSGVPFPSSSYYLSIDALFSIIRNVKTDSLVVTYNILYGYPETVDIDPQQHPVDGGVLYRTSNLRIP